MAFTSRSGCRAWNEPDQRKWREKRINKGWKDVRIIDGTKIVQWLSLFPEVDLWLADKLFPDLIKGLSSPALHWENLQNYGHPPNKLSPDIFLINRKKAIEAIIKVFQQETNQLLLVTKYPEEGADFVTAVLASFDKE